MKDWIQDARAIIEAVGNGAADKALTHDGDFDIYAGGSGGGVNYSEVKLTVTFTFPSPVALSSIKWKMYAYGNAAPPGGYGNARVRIRLYYGGAWHEIRNDFSQGQSASEGSTTESYEDNGPWRGVEKVEVYVKGVGASIYGTECICRVYEVQAWGPNRILSWII